MDVNSTVPDTKRLELAFSDILVYNSAILNAMTINCISMDGRSF